MCTRPERSESKMPGRRHAARATAILWEATSSENPYSPTQNANIEGKRTIEVQLALLDLSKVLKDVCLGA